MAIDLPLLPKAAQVSPRLLDYGITLRPAIGGPLQRVNRLGSRFAVDVSLQPLGKTDARAFLARQADAKNLGDTLKLKWPQPTFEVAVGAPLVNGAGQAGSLLVVDGLTAGVTIPEGAFFSFVVAGVTYLHMTTAAVTASGLGAATLALAPMLRASPADNAAIEFAAPEIEGFLAGSNVEWTLERLAYTGVAFTLEEAQ